MALAPLVKGGSGRRPVLNPRPEFVLLCSMVRFALAPFDLYATIAAASFRRPACEQAIRKAAFRRAPAYAYIYAWRTPVLDGRPGPFHAAELAFTFDNAELCDHYSGGSIGAIVLSKQISTAWVSFARTGNSNHNDLPYWPKYTLERRATMQFDSTCAVSNDPEGQGLS